MRERILRALNSSDLTQREWESEVDVIASLGAAQVRPNAQLTAGAMLLHIRAGHVRYLPRLLAVLTAYIRSKAMRERWRGVTSGRASTLARVALDGYLHPLCRVCNGVGRIGELGKTIVLCSRINGGCGGTGKRQDRYTGWLERVPDVINRLGAWEGYASAMTRKKRGLDVCLKIQYRTG